MSVLIESIRLETELLAQMCYHTCLLGFLGETAWKLARQHICSQKLCRYITSDDWRAVAEMIDKSTN